MKYVFLAGFVSALSLSAQTAAPGQGSIEGQVLSTSGAPLRKAYVSLTPMSVTSAPRDVALQPMRMAQQALNAETDQEGRFQFTGLPAGRYNMRAQRAGYVNQNYGARHSGGPGQPVVLTQDQHFTGAVFHLSPQGVIIGRVVDEDGDPVAVAQIMVYRQVYRDGRKQWNTNFGAACSDLGEFRVANLQPGRYIVSALGRTETVNTRYGSDQSLPDKPKMIYAATYYPNATSQSAAAPLEVTAGSETRGVEIHLVRIPAYHVRGVVNGAPGGRGGTMVTLVPEAGETVNRTSNTNIPVNTNQFDLRDVPPGQYTLVALNGAGPNQMLTEQPVTVGSGHVTGITMTLSPGFDLNGQISVAESGSPVNLQSIRVMIRPTGTFFGAGGPLNVSAAADGRFSLRNVSLARYVVDVAGLPDNCYVQSLKFAGQVVTPAGVEMTGPAPLEIVLSTTAGKITGTATDKDGKPVASATVVLIPETGAATSLSTDLSGSFTFTHLRPGTYKVLAWEDVEDGAWQDPEFRKPYDSRATEIKLGPGEQQNAQLRVVAVEEMGGR